MRSTQEGDRESNQLKETLLGSGLRFSNMQSSLSDARYLLNPTKAVCYLT